jgi:methyltransferase (TIGR00027 family)
MHERRPSQTASMVATARALANDGLTQVPGFRDPYARTMLPPAWASAYHLFTRWAHRAPPERVAKAIEQIDIIPLRVSKVDAELTEAIEGGCRQLVLLGAGLDTRAFRMPSLADVPVYEVDHPATQAYKQRKASSLSPVARSVTFVPVDFESGSLAESLSRTGFRSDQPAVWVWEGVIMYLTEEAVRSTLADVARCSAPGSVLVANYHTPHSKPIDVEHRVRRVLLSLWREPQLGQRTSQAMHDMLRRAGFDLVSDSEPSEWAQRLGAKPTVGQATRVMRIFVARRTGTSVAPP